MAGVLPITRSRTPGRSKNRWYSCQCCCILTVFLLVLTLMGVGLGLGIPALIRMKEGPVLVVGESVERILKNADQSHDPCTNFYNYACGNYGKNGELDENKSKIDVFNDINKKLYEEVEGLLIAPKIRTDPPSYNKVKDFFESCINLEMRDQYEMEPLLTLLNKLGGWPVKEGENWVDLNGNWIHLLSSLYKNGIVPNFIINVDVTIDDLKPDQNILYITPANLPLAISFLTGSNDILTAYHRLMIKVAKYLGAEADAAETEMTQVFNFEKKFAETLLNSEEGMIKKTVNEIEAMLPDLHLLEFFHAILPYKVDGHEPISTKCTQYLRKINNLISRTDMRTLTNYVMWKIIAVSLQFLDNKSINLYNEFHEKIGEKPQDHKTKCVEDTQYFLPNGVSLMYVKKYVNDDLKKTVTNFANDIKEEFLSETEKMKWLDNKTREIAVAKAYQTQFYVAYPEEYLNKNSVEDLYKDLTVSIDTFFQNVMTVKLMEYDRILWTLRRPVKSTLWDIYTDVLFKKARNNFKTNTIEIFVNDLELMYYDKKGPPAFNFGALGSVIAHELFHSIDKKANRYDLNKTLNSWWSQETTENFVEISECFIKKYDGFLGAQERGLDTLAENMADFVGVRTAYKAFRRHLDQKGGAQRLPKQYPWTEEKLFWLSYANLFCSASPRAYTSVIHSPVVFRVNGPLSSLPQFAHDFDCNINSEMAMKNLRCKV